jgi:type IV pilus assembly protein PilE
MDSKRSFRGFTLIELMVAVAVIGILTMIAYPSYQAYVQRSNRTGAKAALQQGAQFMERQFTINNVYPSYTTFQGAKFDSAPIGATGTGVQYTITFDASPPTGGFKLVATPANGSIDPSCGTLTLDNLGNQTSSSGVSADCWAR